MDPRSRRRHRSCDGSDARWSRADHCGCAALSLCARPQTSLACPFIAPSILHLAFTDSAQAQPQRPHSDMSATPVKKTDLAMHAPLPRRTVGGVAVASGAASPQLPPVGSRSPFAASFAAAASPPQFPLHASGLMHAASGLGAGSSSSSPFIGGAASSTSSLLGSPLSTGSSSGGGSRLALLSQEESQELLSRRSGDGGGGDDDDEAAEEQEEEEEDDGDTDGAFLALPPSAHPGSGSAAMARSSSSHSLSMQAGSSGGGSGSGGGRSKRDVSVPLLATQVLPANVYVQQRIGSILSRGMILKADQFPSQCPRGSHARTPRAATGGTPGCSLSSFVLSSHCRFSPSLLALQTTTCVAVSIST